MATVHLRHKEHEGLVFGDGEDSIKFGLRGGFAPGEVIVDTDHPWYPELMRREGHLLEEVTKGPKKVYVSPIDPDIEYGSRAELEAALQAAADDGDALAVAWLQQHGSAPSKSLGRMNRNELLEVAALNGVTFAEDEPTKKVILEALKAAGIE